MTSNDVRKISEEVKQTCFQLNSRFDKLDYFMEKLNRSPNLASARNEPGNQSPPLHQMETIHPQEVLQQPSPSSFLNLTKQRWYEEMKEHITQINKPITTVQ